MIHPNLIPGHSKEYEPLQLVQIYFDTATFDEISRKVFTPSIFTSNNPTAFVFRDVKNTVETQISVIGGTMGLFSGVHLKYPLTEYSPHQKFESKVGAQRDPRNLGLYIERIVVTELSLLLSFFESFCILINLTIWCTVNTIVLKWSIPGFSILSGVEILFFAFKMLTAKMKKESKGKKCTKV